MNPMAPAQPVDELRRAIADVFDVFSVTEAKEPRGAVVFRGRLTVDSDRAFNTIRPRFEQIGYTPLIEPWQDGQSVMALPGVVVVKPSNPMINLVLFLLTIVTTFLTGALYSANLDALLAGQFATSGFSFFDGFTFAASIILILGAHELGHYFVARYYGAPVTLPYFIPMPPLISPIGTMGAVIRLKAPFVNRKSLFDVGIAGPLAGLVFAVPVLLIGLAMSHVGTCPGTCLQEGNSLFYLAAKYAVFGKFLPHDGLDVQLSPVAWAGWVGLFVTVLNLLPAGQLDGGHIVFAILGRRAKYVGYAVIGIMLVLALPALPEFFDRPAFRVDLSFIGSLLGMPGLYYPGWSGWLVWVALIWFTGVKHPIPLNDVSELGMPRKLLGVLAIVIFILLFTLLPFSISQ
ncbi:MAG: site-2 protease family protein [Chloroflexi bacterium]|nr:site-2 protease family protein [Chloroflexota bacterium]